MNDRSTDPGPAVEADGHTNAVSKLAKQNTNRQTVTTRKMTSDHPLTFPFVNIDAVDKGTREAEQVPR